MNKGCAGLALTVWCSCSAPAMPAPPHLAGRQRFLHLQGSAFCPNCIKATLRTLSRNLSRQMPTLQRRDHAIQRTVVQPL
jgi:hypothetical protein